MKQRSKADQVFWDIFFSILFLAIIFGEYILLKHLGVSFNQFPSYFEITLMLLATWRLIRLVTYDKIMRSFRDLFISEKIVSGPRKTIAELLTCPWCISVWIAEFVVFFYYLHPIFTFAYFILSISVVASLLQIFSNFLGWSAEEKKNKCLMQEKK